MKHRTHIFSENIPSSIEDSSAPWTSLVREDFHVAVYEDRYPCTPGHLLFVPKHNTMSVVLDAFNDAIIHGQTMIENGQCDGFNIGMNYGSAAGQTVEWPHVHLIPRRHGDVEDPVGGVRNTIPGKGNYHK
jgi:diadenosine tetraphosphate (Ap4A) HIT family hydrolase